MAQSTSTSALGFQDFFTTTLDGSITSTDTTISLANAPTPTEGFLVIEPDSSTNREIIMYTSVSGNDVVCGSVDDRGIGGTTARTHSSGAIVKMNTVADMFEALQAGTALATGAITVTKIGAGAVTNAKLATSAGEIGAAWADWTPTWANFTPGSATITAKYIQIGKTVFFKLLVSLSGSTMGTSPTFTLPVTAASFDLTNGVIGQSVYKDASPAGTANGVVRLETTTVAQPLTQIVSGTRITIDGITSTAPFTWANSDTFTCVGFYEAA